MTFVSERLEIDIFDDGHMEVSRFLGSEDILDGAELVEQLIQENLCRDGKGSTSIPDDIVHRVQMIDDLERHVASLRSRLFESASG